MTVEEIKAALIAYRSDQVEVLEQIAGDREMPLETPQDWRRVIVEEAEASRGMGGSEEEVQGNEGYAADLMKIAEEIELPPEEFQIEEGDYTTSDHVKWYQYGKLVVTVDENEDYREKLREHMDQEQFWPNAWWISDHGNPSLLNLES